MRRGVGHGEVTLTDALCVSCNVYFFHHAGELGGETLAEWAGKFGFGRRTGVDLPDEAAGTIQRGAIQRGRESFLQRRGSGDADEPDPAETTPDPFSLAIGQGELTATPLQVARMMAAVANGGRLVAPHVTKSGQNVLSRGRTEGEGTESILTERSSDPFLVAVREGLERVVADPQGSAHATVFVESIAIAGKTGTAETGGGRAAHAWFAGYVPAERPRLAFVVVLEHAGSSGAAAGPVAKRLVLRMKELRMF